MSHNNAAYILEDRSEFERLERQSTQLAYDYRSELKDLEVPPHAHLLDAGCGSGVVSRYLAERFPTARVTGCDAAPDRLAQARQASGGQSNLTFSEENLTQLRFADQTFDAVVCRYVVEHLSRSDAPTALHEFFRCLKVGGTLSLIDFDGGLLNLFPMPASVHEGLSRIQSSDQIDLMVGRKLHALMHNAGFVNLQSRIETTEFRGALMAIERELIRERFASAAAFLERVLGGRKQAEQFSDDYLTALNDSTAVLFYNKFIVTGTKPKTLTLVES